jgi:hypothetical protein
MNRFFRILGTFCLLKCQEAIDAINWKEIGNMLLRMVALMGVSVVIMALCSALGWIVLAIFPAMAPANHSTAAIGGIAIWIIFCITALCYFTCKAFWTFFKFLRNNWRRATHIVDEGL